MSSIGVSFTRADALLEKGMMVCVRCGSKYSKLLERCPNPECPSRGEKILEDKEEGMELIGLH